MIRELKLEDKEKYNLLGLLITNNFDKLYNLEDELKKEYTRIYGYYINEELIGFIHVENIQEECSIINIVVDNKYRRKQIASQLLKYVLEKEKMTKCVLEVNQNNIPAIKLYEKFGFKNAGIRKGYYDGGDAIIMVK